MEATFVPFFLYAVGGATLGSIISKMTGGNTGAGLIGGILGGIAAGTVFTLTAFAQVQGIMLVLQYFMEGAIGGGIFGGLAGFAIGLLDKAVKPAQ